jgi:hypothetical protein
MDEQPERQDTADEIRTFLETHTRPRRFGPHFQDLVVAIDWELQAQLAMGTIGKVEPTDEQRRNLAFLIADEVDWRFRLEPKATPGED